MASEKKHSFNPRGKEKVRLLPLGSLTPILHTLTRMTGLVVAKFLVRSDFRRIHGDDVLWRPVFQGFWCKLEKTDALP